MPFDPASVRADFPIFDRMIGGHPLVYLDNGATSQKPRAVIEAMSGFYANDNANIHRGIHTLSREATDAYDAARHTIKGALAVPASHELIFVRGATEGINLAAHCLAASFEPGDEIILTILEHHANIVPWQVLAEKHQLILRYAGLCEDGSLDQEMWQGLFSKKTRLAAFTHVSNVLGTVNPVAEMTKFAHERGTRVLVDGAQALPHGSVDVTAMDPDFYTFSGHKVFGPDGIGVLIGRRDLLDAAPPYQTGGDMIERVTVTGSTFRQSPERFEAGTPFIAGTLGLAAAFNYLATLDEKSRHDHEMTLLSHASEELTKISGLRLLGNAPGKAAIVSFVLEGVHPHDIGSILDTTGVAVRVGHHCAQPLIEYLGVSATVRASFAFYNTHDEIEALMRGMEKVRRFLT